MGLIQELFYLIREQNVFRNYWPLYDLLLQLMWSLVLSKGGARHICECLAMLKSMFRLWMTTVQQTGLIMFLNMAELMVYVLLSQNVWHWYDYKVGFFT